MHDHVSHESGKTTVAKMELSIGEVGASTLTDRFSEVRHCIAELLKPDSNKVEAVHQVRVASRRTKAGFDFFRSVLDRSFCSRAVKQLKKLRSGLGELRDLDVMSKKIDHLSSKGADRLRGMIRHDYDDAMQKMDSAVRNFVSNLPPEGQPLEVPIRSSAKKLATSRFKEWAFRRADKIAQRFLVSLRHADLTAESLHRLRIRGKQLRYTLEILVPFAPEIVGSPAYRRLKKLQTILGEIQDGIVQRETLERLTKNAGQWSVRRFAKEESRERKRKHAELLRRFRKLRSKRQRKAFSQDLDRLLSLSRN